MTGRKFNDGRFIVMFHGNVSPDRGVDSLIRLLVVNPHVTAAVLGNAANAPGYIDTLRGLAEELGVSERVIFHKAVPNSELRNYVGAADVGVVVHPDTSLNARYSLPNKVFENIQSLTPLIVSDLPELGRLVRHYGIGLTHTPGDITSLNEQVEKMRTDIEFYSLCRKNLVKAKEELCWEQERAPLEEAYRGLLNTLQA